MLLCIKLRNAFFSIIPTFTSRKFRCWKLTEDHLYRVLSNSPYKLLGLVERTELIIFWIGTHVRKLTVPVLQPFENKHCLNVRHVPQQAIPWRFVRLQSYMMRGACVRITWCQSNFILPLGAGSSLIHVSFSVRAIWLSTLLLNTRTWSFEMAKLEVMEELLVAFIKIVFHKVRLHRIPFSP